MQCDFCDWGRRIAEGYNVFSSVFGTGKTASSDELTGLSRLNSLKIHISDVKCLPKLVRFNPKWVDFNVCISRKDFMKQSYYGRFFERKLPVKLNAHRHLFRYLALNTSMESLPCWFIDVVTEKAEILEYIGYTGLKNILVEYHHGRLHGLKYLGVIECFVVSEVLMNSTTRRVLNKLVLESLIELYLEGVCGLRLLCDGELTPGSLCNLKLLNVRNCLELVGTLLQSNLLQRLQNLEILHCEYTEDARGTNMEYVFGFGGLEIVLPKLREIICLNHP